MIVRLIRRWETSKAVDEQEMVLFVALMSILECMLIYQR